MCQHNIDFRRGRRTLVRDEALAGGAALDKRQRLLWLALEALAYKRVQRRQPVQQRRGVFGVQRVAGEAGVDEGAQLVGTAANLVVLLSRFDDGGEVQPTKALELLRLPGDAVELAQHFLQQLLALLLAELWLRRGVARLCVQALAGLGSPFALVSVLGQDTGGQWLQLLLTGRGAIAQLLRDFLDEAVDLFQLDVGELVDEGLFVVIGPGGVILLVVLEQLLELFVVDVVAFPWRVHAFAQGGAELHRCALAEDSDSSARAVAQVVRNGRLRMLATQSFASQVKFDVVGASAANAQPVYAHVRPCSGSS
jgi:hypothetical protein